MKLESVNVGIVGLGLVSDSHIKLPSRGDGILEYIGG